MLGSASRETPGGVTKAPVVRQRRSHAAPRNSALPGERRAAFYFLAPAVVGIALFYYIAMAVSGYLSLTRYNVLSPPQWVGLENFRYLLADERFLRALWNTTRLAVIGVPVTIVLALGLAVALNSKVKFRSVYRLIFFLPLVTIPVAAAVVWRWLYAPDIGLINQLLHPLGVERVEWLSRPQSALWAVMGMEVGRGTTAGALPERPVPSHPVGRAQKHSPDPLRGSPRRRSVGVAAVPAHHTAPAVPFALFSQRHGSDRRISDVRWRQSGLFLLILLAGLKNIPRIHYEAALVEGASAWQQFLRITLPLLSPSLFFLSVTGAIAAFQTFDAVVVLTPSGGPQDATRTVVFDVYRNAFTHFRMGRAAAGSLFLLLVILLITVVQLRAQNRWVHYE